MPRLRAMRPVRTDSGVHFAAAVEELASVVAAALFTLVECNALHGRRGRWARAQSLCMLPAGMSAVTADARYEKLGRRVTDSEHRTFPRHLRHFDGRLQIRLRIHLFRSPSLSCRHQWNGRLAN